MKLYLQARNSKGKRQGIGDNEAIEFQLLRGNDIIAELTYLDGLLILNGADNSKIQFSQFPKEKKLTSMCDNCGEPDKKLEPFLNGNGTYLKICKDCYKELLAPNQKRQGEHQHQWQKMNNDCYWCKTCQATKDSDGGIIE